MIEPIAVVRSVDDLHAALRQRATALNISRATIDEVAGLPGGYSGKILAPRPVKRLGSLALNLLLPTLGLQLVLVEDEAALARLRTRLVAREVAVPSRACLWAGKARIEVSRRWVRRIAADGGRARARALSPKERSKQARAAAVYRWKTIREIVRGAERKRLPPKRKAPPREMDHRASLRVEPRA
jgi:hypothetical protein